MVYVYHSDAAKAGLNGHQRSNRICAGICETNAFSCGQQPGSDFPVMQKIKQLFDPKLLLNRGRLYGRI